MILRKLRRVIFEHIENPVPKDDGLRHRDGKNQRKTPKEKQKEKPNEKPTEKAKGKTKGKKQRMCPMLKCQ